MITLDLIDSHQHLCLLSEASYPWLEGPAVPRYHGDDLPLRRDYLVRDYLNDAAELTAVGARLVGSVHVENGAADPLWEATWIDGLITRSPVPTVQVAKADLTRADVEAHLAQLATLRSVRGIRDILNWHPDPLYTHRHRADLLTATDWRRGFAALSMHGLSFDLQVFPAQLRDASRLAADFGGTSIVLDHAGMPIERDADALVRWRRGLDSLAAESNTVVKISALGTNDHRWTTDSIRRVVLETIDAFGPSRTMFGSNFPVDGLYSTYGRIFEAFLEIVSQFTVEEKADMFAGTAQKFYRM